METKVSKIENRNNLIAKISELGIVTKNPITSYKDSFLEELIEVAINAKPIVKVKNENTLSKRILELAMEGKSKIDIFNQMKSEGVDRIRYGYILLVLKTKGVTVPKAERVTQVKAAAVEDVKAIEELVASTPEVTEEAPE